MKRLILIGACILMCIQTGCEQKKEEPKLQLAELDEAVQDSTTKASLTEQKSTWEGEWHRTAVVTSLGGTLIIRKVDEEGFDFELCCMYYSHSGEVHDKAYFESAKRAVCQVKESFGERHEVLTFELQDGVVMVTASDGSQYLPFGANVTADGEYIKGEPIYTNAGILAETFTEMELEAIKRTIDDEEIYEEYFKFPVEYGVITTQECMVGKKSPARLIKAFLPTMGGYDFLMLLTENGEVYIDFGAEEIPYKTSVPGAVDFPEYEVK